MLLFVHHCSRRALAGILVILSLTFPGCSSAPTYEFDYDKSFDFDGLKTYRWYDDVVDSRVADYRRRNPSDKRVREAVGREMARRGFIESATGQVDFWLNYSLSKQKQRVENITGYGEGFHGGAAAGTYGRGVSLGYSTGPSVREYEDGTAVLDVIDAKTQRIVWRGIAEGRLKNERNMKDKYNATVKVTQELLAEFPPRQ